MLTPIHYDPYKAVDYKFNTADDSTCFIDILSDKVLWTIDCSARLHRGTCEDVVGCFYLNEKDTWDFHNHITKEVFETGKRDLLDAEFESFQQGKFYS